jgi:hypothetical protein
MTQEEKDLLLKDLCSRLPYGVKGVNKAGIVTDPSDWYCGFVRLSKELENRICFSDWKPYLFPLSSITEKQEKELNNYLMTDKKIMMRFVKEIDWLYKHHFDVHNLIHYGLAIDCTNLNIY